MKERKNNLDVLRILSMLFIVSLHYLGVGGAFFNIEDGNVSAVTVNYVTAAWLEALAIVGVNCFVLISGYFLINSTFKWKKVGSVCLTTLFFSVIMFVIYSAIFGFSLGNMLRSFLPVLMSTYWFITVYLVLYILSPYINILCNHLTQKQHRTLILILVLVFSVWKCVMPFAKTLDTSRGYSLTWFIVLYICGAYIGKYGLTLFKKNFLNLLAYIGISFLMLGIRLAAIFLSPRFPILAEGQNLFYHYDSVTVFMSAIFLFVFFSRLKLEGKFVERAVRFLVPSVFSIYLIHENFLWREKLWNGLMRADTMVGSPLFILHFIGCVLAVFAGCILIDQIRKGIFYILPKITKRLFRKDT